MYTQLNEKYIALCSCFGINLQIHTVTNVPKYQITEREASILIEINVNVPESIGYEKILVWAVREVLLPRLVLETENLLIRRFSPDDREKCLLLLSDEEDCFMDCCRCFPTKDDDYYQRVEAFLQNKTQYAVVLRSSGELIGIFHVFPDDSRAVDAMEVGYSIARPYQRRGYATEMLKEMLVLLEDKLLVDTISAGVLPENKASIALLEKVGFQREGFRHHAVWHEVLDKPVDILYFYHDRAI